MIRHECNHPTVTRSLLPPRTLQLERECDYIGCGRSRRPRHIPIHTHILLTDSSIHRSIGVRRNSIYTSHLRDWDLVSCPRTRRSAPAQSPPCTLLISCPQTRRITPRATSDRSLVSRSYLIYTRGYKRQRRTLDASCTSHIVQISHPRYGVRRICDRGALHM